MRLNILLFGALLILLSTQVVSVQAVSCNEIWIDSEDIEMERNETEYFYFPIHNESWQDFDVSSVEVWRESGDFEIIFVDYPDEIEAEGQGEITVGIRNPHLSRESRGSAYIKVKGRFEHGEYCGFRGIDKEFFEVDVVFDGSETECRDIKINAWNVYIDEDSRRTFSFSIENDSRHDFELYDIKVEEQSSYFDAFVYRKPGEIESWDNETFKIRVESNRVSSDKSGTVTVEAKGRFDNGDYCSYSNVREETFRVFVEDGYSGSGSWQRDCDEISLSRSTVRVEKGKTSYATFFFENYSSQDFLIDWVSIFDSDPNFKAEENGYAKVVPAFGSSYVNVKVRAYDYAETGEFEAFVEAVGRFQDNESCRLFDGGIATIPVKVEEAELPYSNSIEAAGSCSLFSLIVPEAKAIGNAGTVEISIDNRTMERATIRLSGPGLTVQPVLISVPRYTLVSEMVSVSSVLPETSLVYSIEAIGCNQTKATKIIAAVEGQEEGIESAEQEEMNEATQAISTGFLLLGQAAAGLGLLVIIVLAIYLVIKR